MDCSFAHEQGRSLSSPAGRWLLAAAVLGSGMVFLDGTVVNVALPRIGTALRASTSALQWVLDGYLLTLTSLITLGGALGDRYGRRRVFAIGATLFAVSSLLCAMSATAAELLAARMLQGAGGALLAPGSLAMIESSFRPADRARAIGAWSGLGGVVAALGPLLGGYLVEAVSWRAIFLINIPLAAIVIVVARRHVAERRDMAARGPLDLVGAMLAVVALAGIAYALIEGLVAGASAAILGSGIGGMLVLCVFLLWERGAANPMVPLSLFDSKQFSSANAVTFVVYAALGGVFFLLVAFLQVALRYTPMAAGAAALPATALMLALSARAGALAQRIGPRAPLALGCFLIASGLLLMTQIDPGARYLSSVLPAVLVFGLGLTIVVAPVTATVLASADDRLAGTASAINNAVSRLGGLIAVAVLPLIGGLSGRRFYLPLAMAHGFHIAMAACSLLALAGGVLSWLTISPHALDAAFTGAGSGMQILRERSCSVTGTPLYLSSMAADRARPPRQTAANTPRG
ncbi:MAG TPA: DHA2 family efflux MFS transporter permease subunit [Solirubrobacteraceae bacterium]|nr:DHA2 family efflux MFS transporter permease subunit [Solirubrobacteraceae bacterium]